MELIKHLGLGSNGPSINTLVSACGDGKTTLSCIIAGEYVKDGKNVLFLNDEMSLKNMVNQLKIAIEDPKDLSRLTVHVIQYKNEESQLKNAIGFINKVFEAKHYDIIMLDGLTYNDESFDMFRRIALEKNCVIITAQQARRIIDSEQVKIMVNPKAMLMSEVVFGINRNVKLNFWSRVKYFFCFWKQKPNRNLKVLKSRYGKESSKNIFVDFKNVKIIK